MLAKLVFSCEKINFDNDDVDLSEQTSTERMFLARDVWLGSKVTLVST